jgi:AraC-like DNA-binding protein
LASASIQASSRSSERTPLAQYNVFQTQDTEEARVEVSNLFCPHELRPHASDEPFLAVHNCAPLAGTTFEASLSFISYGSPVTIAPVSLDSFYLVNIPFKGSVNVSINGRNFAASSTRPYLLNAADRIKMEWSPRTPHLVVRLDKTALETRLTELLNRAVAPGKLTFSTLLDPGSPRVRSWLRLVAFLRDELEYDQGLVHGSPAREHYQDLLVTGFLLAQPNNFSRKLDVDPAPPMARSIRRAVEYIGDHLAEPLTSTVIASNAGLGIRALQVGFKRHFDQTPSEYVRNLRLEQAHRDLLGADAAGVESVTEICLRWGFTHQGRFASAYRARYGVMPSQTLRSAP